MFYSEIQKKATYYNKNKYLKTFLIPTVSVIFLFALTLMPFGISKVFDFFKLIAPLKYSPFFSVMKCLFLLCVSFIACLFYCTISLGEEALYGGRYTKKKNCFKRFFYWFKPSNSIKAFALRSTIFFIKIFWSIIFLLPSVVTFAIVFIMAFSGGIEVYLFISLSAGSIALLISGLIFRYIMIQRYFLAGFILAENPETGIIRCIKQSKNLVNGQIMKIVRFKLSFIPLQITCLLIFPLIFVYPHYKQSRCILAKELMI